MDTSKLTIGQVSEAAKKTSNRHERAFKAWQGNRRKAMAYYLGIENEFEAHARRVRFLRKMYRLFGAIGIVRRVFFKKTLLMIDSFDRMMADKLIEQIKHNLKH